MANRTHHKEAAQLRKNIIERDIQISKFSTEREVLNNMIDRHIQTEAMWADKVDAQTAQIEALKAELLTAVTALEAKTTEYDRINSLIQQASEGL
jgi:hypothetical protein